MSISRSVFLRALRWKIEFHALPAWKKAIVIGLPVAALLCAYLDHHFRLWKHLPKSGTWEDVLLGTFILAVVPFAMAAYGGHLAAEAEPDPKKKFRIKSGFWAACVVGVIVAFVQQHKSLTEDAVAKAKTEKVEGAVLGQLEYLHEQKPTLTPEQAEAKRREDIMLALRGQYILQHENVSSGIVDGSEPLPADWVNQRLHELNEVWGVSESAKRASAVKPPRSYLLFPDNPIFAGHDPVGSSFQVGDGVAFNLNYRVEGPNAVDFVSIGRIVHLVTSIEITTQQGLADEFSSDLKEESKKLKVDASSTMLPTQSSFVSAFTDADPSKTKRLTQDELQNLSVGKEFIFVLAELTYKDNGTRHHTRRCMWLQPPSQAPGIWHYCEVFQNSD